MKVLKAAEIAEITGGRLLCGDPDTEIRHISIDSRSMKGDDLFVPIIGERTDAHKYIESALQNGAAASLTSEHDEADSNLPWIRVEDTVAALQAIGRYLRGQMDMPFIGVTGSVGKTSTREMITTALSAGLTVTQTAGNSNSQLGVPITLSEMYESADIAVMEMGMSMPGEMARLASIAQVNSAVITNIGVSHIENLGSQENILKEKMHIADGFGPDNTIILNGDDPLLAASVGTLDCRYITYGTSEGNDYRAADIDTGDAGAEFTLIAPGQTLKVRLGVPGRHNVMNALAAFACADLYHVDLKAAAGALADYHGYARRLQIIELDGFCLIDDSYNASPDSMRAALDVLSDHDCKGRRVAVLADMLELGPEAEKYHNDIGVYAAGRRLDQIFTVGPLAARIASAAESRGVRAAAFSTNAEVIERLKSYLRRGDAVLLKGSNGMHLNEVGDVLKGLHI